MENDKLIDLHNDMMHLLSQFINPLSTNASASTSTSSNSNSSASNNVSSGAAQAGRIALSPLPSSSSLPTSPIPSAIQTTNNTITTSKTAPVSVITGITPSASSSTIASLATSASASAITSDISSQIHPSNEIIKLNNNQTKLMKINKKQERYFARKNRKRKLNYNNEENMIDFLLGFDQMPSSISNQTNIDSISMIQMQQIGNKSNNNANQDNNVQIMKENQSSLPIVKTNSFLSNLLKGNGNDIHIHVSNELLRMIELEAMVVARGGLNGISSSSFNNSSSIRSDDDDNDDVMIGSHLIDFPSKLQQAMDHYARMIEHKVKSRIIVGYGSIGHISAYPKCQPFWEFCSLRPFCGQKKISRFHVLYPPTEGIKTNIRSFLYELAHFYQACGFGNHFIPDNMMSSELDKLSSHFTSYDMKSKAKEKKGALNSQDIREILLMFQKTISKSLKENKNSDLLVYIVLPMNGKDATLPILAEMAILIRQLKEQYVSDSMNQQDGSSNSNSNNNNGSNSNSNNNNNRSTSSTSSNRRKTKGDDFPNIAVQFVHEEHIVSYKNRRSAYQKYICSLYCKVYDSFDVGNGDDDGAIDTNKDNEQETEMNGPNQNEMDIVADNATHDKIRSVDAPVILDCSWKSEHNGNESSQNNIIVDETDDQTKPYLVHASLCISECNRWICASWTDASGMILYSRIYPSFESIINGQIHPVLEAWWKQSLEIIEYEKEEQNIETESDEMVVTFLSNGYESISTDNDNNNNDNSNHKDERKSQIEHEFLSYYHAGRFQHDGITIVRLYTLYLTDDSRLMMRNSINPYSDNFDMMHLDDLAINIVNEVAGDEYKSNLRKLAHLSYGPFFQNRSYANGITKMKVSTETARSSSSSVDASKSEKESELDMLPIHVNVARYLSDWISHL